MRFLGRAIFGVFVLTLCVVAAAQDAPEPFRFTIGVEDELRVYVYGQPDLSLNVRVRPDGMITVPLANDIPVIGKTSLEVKETIQERLSEFVRDPNVTVMVEQINSFRVYFVGEVASQGAQQFYRPIRVLQAIAVAGGPSEFSKREVTLLREGPDGEERIEIDYKKLLAGEAENIYLQPGDTLIFR